MVSFCDGMEMDVRLLFWGDVCFVVPAGELLDVEGNLTNYCKQP